MAKEISEAQLNALLKLAGKKLGTESRGQHGLPGFIR